MDFLARLSPIQREAATYLTSPLCILAGAGTGKTRVITHRIAYLIDQRAVLPENILAVTFTNKASGEMRERVEHLLPGKGHRVILGTFHGLAARFLRHYGPYVDVPNAFLIYDADDSERLIKRLGTENGVVKDRLPQLIDLIFKWQQEGLRASHMPVALDIQTNKFIEVFRRFEEEMKQIGALSFDGLLLKWRELLQHPEASERIFAQVRHVLVDEYQDTNDVQADIVHLLGKHAESIAIVGDDDQSIYGWRGASSANMQRFLQEMPSAHLIRLEENYRSTEHILQAANHIIAKNNSRIGKNLRSMQGKGEKIELIRLTNDLAEAQRIVHIAQEHSRGEGSLNDMAVLMRTNAMSRPIEDALRQAGIAYRLYGGVKFYERREVKDALAALRAAIQPQSDVDLLRLLQAIPRGIGDSSLEKVRQVARQNSLSLFEALHSSTWLTQAGIPARTQTKILDFSQRFWQVHEQIKRSEGDSDGYKGLHADEALAFAVEMSGIAERLQQEETAESLDRLDNINQLISAARQFVEEAQDKNEPTDALAFLQTTALLSATDLNSGNGENTDALTLMTLHAAKGLEFHTVVMIGMEEYGFPHARALEEGAKPGELEEERRLAYVGMTRAKARLLMTYAQRRMLRGSVKGRIPSRFLRDMPASLVSGDLPYSTSYDSEPSYAPKPVLRPQFSKSPQPIQTQRHYIPDDTEDASEIRKGTFVRHAVFGRGRVVGQRGMGSLKRLCVFFENEQEERVIIARHLQVE